MKLKCVVIGGLAFFVVAQLLGFITGPLIHEGLLKADYQANAGFWRPELNQDPPDMAALLPGWILNGLILSLVVAWLYCRCKCGEGPGWKRGFRFGIGLGIFTCTVMLAWSGIFNLPSKIWIFWGVESIVSYAVCCAAMGWAVGKWCDDDTGKATAAVLGAPLNQ